MNTLPSDKPAVNISALKGTGLKELKKEIVRTALKRKIGTETTIVTNIRHTRALERALHSINSFEDALKEGLSAEFLSIELREALDAIGEITGATTPEEILDRIFSNFCIGK
jgi:tRNA modification GTPase